MKENDEEKIETQENIDNGDHIEETDSFTSKEEINKKSKKSKLKIAEDKLKDENKALAEAHDELKDKYLRLVAEYDNYRKRTSKEKIELSGLIKASVMFDFLSVVDDVDRAILHIDDVKDLEATVEGVKLISNKFKDFLKSQGIAEIDAIGEEFDTDLHEAVTKFPVEDEDERGKVIDVVQKGYKINDRVIRFTKVVVGE